MSMKTDIIGGLDGLIEATRYQKEMGRMYDSPLQRLDKYIDKPWVFIHFSDVNKLGLNPKSKFNTPLGVYGYPLTKRIAKQLKQDRVPFASDRKFMHLYKVKPSATKRHYTFGPGPYSSALKANEYLSKLEILRKKYPDHADGFEKWAASAKDQKPMGRLWNVTRELAHEVYRSRPMLGWNKLLRAVGVDGLVDFGTKLIHEAEPTQAVALNGRQLQQIDTFETSRWRRGVLLDLISKDDEGKFEKFGRLATRIERAITRAELFFDAMRDGVSSSEVGAVLSDLREMEDKNREAQKIADSAEGLHNTSVLKKRINRLESRLAALINRGTALYEGLVFLEAYDGVRGRGLDSLTKREASKMRDDAFRLEAYLGELGGKRKPTSLQKMLRAKSKELLEIAEELRGAGRMPEEDMGRVKGALDEIQSKFDAAMQAAIDWAKSGFDLDAAYDVSDVASTLMSSFAGGESLRNYEKIYKDTYADLSPDPKSIRRSLKALDAFLVTMVNAAWALKDASEDPSKLTKARMEMIRAEKYMKALSHPLKDELMDALVSFARGLT